MNERWHHDLIINLLAGITILGLPFTFAAIVRALWLIYKITNKICNQCMDLDWEKISNGISKVLDNDSKIKELANKFPIDLE